MAAGAGAVVGAAARPKPPLAGDKATLQQQQFAVVAATSGRIKYADPRSLPSFPSSGLAPDGAAASAAATLGWANQKPVNPWKPNKTSSASAAAVLASDHKMASQPQPAPSADGHKAALLAVGSAGAALKQVRAAKPSSTAHDSWGNSAATQAFHANRPASAEPPNLSHGSSAATQAFMSSRSLSTRKAPSSAASPSDMSTAAAKESGHARQQASSNALDGATRAHRAALQARPQTPQGGSVSVVTMTRSMFTSAPPVKLEVDERSDNERMHQSAVEMKKIYISQQKMADQVKNGQADQSQADQPSPYLNLQDAAYKQAQERLAKLHDEHMKSREYQEYYGSERSPRHKFSVAAKLRRRLSDSDSQEDHQRSRQIREQMSMFSSKLSQVDQKKREKDREALLAVAQRNVKARLQSMDDKATLDTGKPGSTKLTEWDVKAQQAAQKRHDSRTENWGKVDIEGGKFMAPDEVDAIAIKRVQPVLDEINKKAESERERQAVLWIEEEERREEAEKQKAREREAKEVQRRLKEQEKQEEKARKQQEKMEEKAKRDEEKAAKAEEKRHAKEDVGKSRHDMPAASSQRDDEYTSEIESSPRHDEPLGSNPPRNWTAVETEGESPATSQRKADLSTSPTSKVKVWIKNRFSRGKSLSEHGEKKRGFLGGAAMKEQEASSNNTSVDKRSTSLRDVAMAGKGDVEGDAGGAAFSMSRNEGETDSDRDSHGVSPASTPLEEEERRLGDETGGQQGYPGGLEPPRPIQDGAERVSCSPTRDSRFREMIDP